MDDFDAFLETLLELLRQCSSRTQHTKRKLHKTRSNQRDNSLQQDENDVLCRVSTVSFAVCSNPKASLNQQLARDCFPRTRPMFAHRPPRDARRKGRDHSHATNSNTPRMDLEIGIAHSSHTTDSKMIADEERNETMIGKKRQTETRVRLCARERFAILMKSEPNRLRQGTINISLRNRIN